MSDQPDADGVPERPTKPESAIGRVGAKLISTVPKPLLGIRGTLYKRLFIKSLENYHKVAGGDAIAINAKPGQTIDLEPVLYQSPAEADDGEKAGWSVKGRDKTWNAGKHGRTVDYLGRTPTVLLEDDDHVEAGWLAPRIGEAIELDNYWPLFVNPEINAVIDYQGGAGGQQPAVADGGYNINLELDSPGQWAQDNIIDLGSGDGYSGMRISSKKAAEWRAEEADSEEMQRQEDRGKIMAMLQDNQKDVVKLFLYAAIFCVVVIGLVLLGPQLIGGGGGGGGSINPLMVSALSAMGAF